MNIIKGATSALLFGGLFVLAGCGSSCCKKETKEDATAVVTTESVVPATEAVATPAEATVTEVTEVVAPAQEQPAAKI